MSLQLLDGDTPSQIGMKQSKAGLETVCRAMVMLRHDANSTTALDCLCGIAFETHLTWSTQDSCVPPR